MIDQTLKKIYAVIFITSIILSLLLITGKFFLESVPDNFSYKADILSRYNLYNATLGDFLGEQTSKNQFLYQTVSQKGNIVAIANSFEVRDSEGNKIFAIERLYGIDKTTGKHREGYGDRDREGYLFAPRELEKGDDYVYWHINYDNPALMKFQAEEYVYGLKVYRYQAEFSADQTQNLLYLPGVPEENGIRLNVTLQTWIEPLSGRLIKYEDSSYAYYYSLATGEILHPWNTFSNRYVEDSVKHQVALAQKEKLKLVLIGKILPFTLSFLVIVLLVLFLRMKPRK